MDFHSLNAHMILITPDDEPLSGVWVAYNNDMSARFELSGAKVPNRIVIRNRLEDVAGNTIVEAFDHAVGEFTANRVKQTTTFDLGSFTR